MSTLLEGLIFAVLVIPLAIGWLLWQRHVNRFEVPDGDESIPSNEEIEQRMSELLPAKSPDKEDS